MAFQVTIARNSRPNETRLWFIASAVLLLLLLNTLGVAFKFTTQLFSLTNVALSMVFMITLFRLNGRKPDVVFLKIQENEVEYFDAEEGQLVLVPKSEIKSVNTGFNELRIYTDQRIHTIDLSYVRDEKTRWEIKEAVKSTVNQNSQCRVLPIAG
ncbi:MAG TPA: hypothetical protein VGE26_06820 [Sphingobacteriaceae bacterium]